MSSVCASKDMDAENLPKKRNVLFVIESLGCGGAEKSLVSLLALLDRQRYNLSIWIIHPEGAFMHLLPNDIQLVEQPKYNWFESLLVKFSSVVYSIVWRLNNMFGKKEYWGETYYKCRGWTIKVPKGKWNVVLAYHQGLVTYIVADKFKGCKKVGWVNADIFKAGYNIKYNSRFYRKIDCICLVSDILHKMMDERIPEFLGKYHTVWDIIDPDLTRKLSVHPVKELKKSPKEFVFVTTGRLHALKGFDIAVEAARFLKNKGLSFKWYFIGEGAERNNIERMISAYGLQDNVMLMGLQTNPYPYMAQADVYVQTSRHEGFGMTIAEAKILGLPIVTTNFDVVYNQIEHGKNGLVAEMDGEKVGEQILNLVQNDDVREQIRNAVLKEKNTTCKTEVKKVEEIIDDLTS